MCVCASPKSEAWQRWEEPGWEGVDTAGVKGQCSCSGCMGVLGKQGNNF